MAKLKKSNLQNYPRIEDEENPFSGFFDESKVTPHKTIISDSDLKNIIKKAVQIANAKSSRAILNIHDNVSEEEINKIYIKEGKAVVLILISLLISFWLFMMNSGGYYQMMALLF